MTASGGFIIVGAMIAVLAIVSLVWLGTRVIAAVEREIAVLFGAGGPIVHAATDAAETTRATSGSSENFAGVSSMAEQFDAAAIVVAWHPTGPIDWSAVEIRTISGEPLSSRFVQLARNSSESRGKLGELGEIEENPNRGAVHFERNSYDVFPQIVDPMINGDAAGGKCVIATLAVGEGGKEPAGGLGRSGVGQDEAVVTFGASAPDSDAEFVSFDARSAAVEKGHGHDQFPLTVSKDKSAAGDGVSSGLPGGLVRG